MRLFRHYAFIIFLGSLFVFTLGLSTQEVIGFDSRFYLFAKEMLKNGFSFFPTTYGEPYPDYSAASTIVITLLAHLAGGLNKFIAVLPTAILAALTVTLTYLIGALVQKRWGIYAALMMLITITFLKSARAISLDMYPALFTAACFYLIYSAEETGKFKHLWLIFPLLFGSFIFRGPIGLVLPAGVICSFYFIRGQFKKLFVIGSLMLVLLIACTALLLFTAWHVGGQAFMQDVLRMQVLGRIDNYFLPRYFYFTNSISNYALSYPLACLVIVGLGFASKALPTREKQLLHLLLGWMLIILLGMSIPGDKKVRYILPMVPAIALLSAYIFIAPSSARYYALLRKGLVALFFLFPVIFLIALDVIVQFKHHIHFPVLPFFAISLNLVVWQLANVLILYYLQCKPGTFCLVLSAALCVVFVNAMIVEPSELYLDRAQHFVVQMESKRLAEHAQLVFYKERPDGLPIKYLINMPQLEKPIFIASSTALLQFKGPAFFVASESYFMELPGSVRNQFKRIAQHPLGHVPVLVFEKK